MLRAGLGAGASSLSDGAVSVTYFAGSLFFTAAAAEQFRTVARDDRLDLIASGVQLAGTILFNLSTHTAMDDHLDGRSTDRLLRYRRLRGAGHGRGAGRRGGELVHPDRGGLLLLGGVPPGAAPCQLAHYSRWPWVQFAGLFSARWP